MKDYNKNYQGKSIKFINSVIVAEYKIVKSYFKL